MREAETNALVDGGGCEEAILRRLTVPGKARGSLETVLEKKRNLQCEGVKEDLKVKVETDQRNSNPRAQSQQLIA
jgi:hypothetical protein